MRGLSSDVELLRFEKDPDNSEWYVAQLAVGGVKSIPFSIAAPDIHNFNDEDSLMAYLERKAREMVATYGDARSPNPNAFSEYMEA